MRVADPPDRDQPVDKGGLAGAARGLDVYLCPVVAGLNGVEDLNVEGHNSVYAVADTRYIVPDEIFRADITDVGGAMAIFLFIVPVFRFLDPGFGGVEVDRSEVHDCWDAWNYDVH